MADLIRTLTAMVAAFDVGAVAVVLALYLQAWRRAPAGYRMLPRHVAEVSLGSLGLIVGIGLAVFDSVGQPDLSWRIPALYLPALLIFALGIVDVGRLQRQHLATPLESAEPARCGGHAMTTTPTPVPPGPARHRPARARWGGVALGVALVALGVFVAVDYTRFTTCQAETSAAVAAALEARQSAVEAKYDADRRLVTVLADPATETEQEQAARGEWLDTIGRLDAAQVLNPPPPPLRRCS